MSFASYHANDTARRFLSARIGGYAARYSAPVGFCGIEPGRRFAIGIGASADSTSPPASFRTTFVGSLEAAQAEAWRLAGGTAEAHILDVLNGARWRRAPGDLWSRT